MQLEISARLFTLQCAHKNTITSRNKLTAENTKYKNCKATKSMQL